MFGSGKPVVNGKFVLEGKRFQPTQKACDQNWTWFLFRKKKNRETDTMLLWLLFKVHCTTVTVAAWNNHYMCKGRQISWTVEADTWLCLLCASFHFSNLQVLHVSVHADVSPSSYQYFATVMDCQQRLNTWISSFLLNITLHYYILHYYTVHDSNNINLSFSGHFEHASPNNRWTSHTLCCARADG